jgi:transcriptional regulator with XRE-family HTH domain
MDVSDRLREARKLAGMRQQDLADALGVSDTTVIMWENPRYQRRIPPKHLKKIAEILRVEVSDLLGEPAPANLPAASLTTNNLAEKQLLKLFRLMPEELQLVQLAQFIECASAGDFGRARRQNPTPTDTTVLSGEGRDSR